MTELKVASINTGGLKSVERRQLLFNFCRDGDFDIVGLQEVAFHACPIIESRYHLFTNLCPNKNGTVILLRHGLNHSRILLDPDGRLISIDSITSLLIVYIHKHLCSVGKTSKGGTKQFSKTYRPCLCSYIPSSPDHLDW